MAHYYHGSTQELTRIDPRPSNVLGGESAVFATDDKLLALIFIAKWNDDDLSVGYINNKLYVGEKYHGALNLLVVNGYLHTVSSANFIHDNRCGLRNEHICKGPVEVINIELIPCVLSALRDAGVWVMDRDEFPRDFADLL